MPSSFAGPGPILVAARTDAGRVRPANEDAVVARLDRVAGHIPCALIAVADGVGGSGGGAVASHRAIVALGDAVTARCPGLRVREASSTDERAAALAADLAAVIGDVRAILRTDLRPAGGAATPNTTLTAAFVCAGITAFVHLGDSRGYLLRGGALRRLTRDHTVAQELVAAGVLAADDAPFHRGGAALTRYLAADRDFVPESDHLLTQPDDLLIACTDGLYRVIGEDAICRLCRQAPLVGQADLDALADRLVARANAFGGPDNISVALAAVGR